MLDATTDTNKAIARRIWEEIFPAMDVAALAEVSDPDVVHHGARPDEPRGLEGVTQTMLWLGSVFSDQRWEVQQVIAEGDLVALTATHHARHTGEMMGIAPTGREVAYDYIHVFRLRDGKIVEHWGQHDGIALMRQLGVRPG